MYVNFQTVSYRRLVDIILGAIEQFINLNKLILRKKQPISETRVVELIQQSVIDYKIGDDIIDVGQNSKAVTKKIDHKLLKI